MEVVIAIISGLFFAFILYFSMFFRLNKNKRLELIDWFLISLATFNGLMFTFVVWATYEGRNPSYIFSYYVLGLDLNLIIVYVILNFCLAFCVYAGWNLTSLILKKRKLKIFEETIYLKKILLISWLMFFVSVIAYWLYTKAYGGFISYLSYARAIRSGVFTVQNPFSFLQRFGSFSFFSSYIFFAFFIDKKLKSKSVIIGLILSFFFSLYVLYSWVGRVGLVVFISTFLLGYILYSYKSAFGFIRKIITFAILSLLLLIFADVILGRSSRDIGIIELFSKEFAFPLSTFYSVIHLSQYRWFVDLIVSPLYIFPMRIWSGLFNIETASSFNTFLISGARKGEMGIYGEIPVDMLSFSLMQANILGIFVVGLIWGAILYIIQRLINKIPVTSIRSVISANLILNVVMLSVMYGDPQHIIVRNFYMIIGFMLLNLILKIKLAK
ncbi:O-antigen polymerase [Garciella nitratireducens]|uniref:O-antigen polymerase n=1 Tax=Garciella nitratireducens TaxID=218205 RepID=UPI000DE93888|nr:O-antigen polymerase [Garciella nitratireducens]RBP42237.1 hypothetical protein DFR81_10935 [Garciella nitratireducens]